MSKTFIDAVLDGEALAQDIDSYVEAWHTEKDQTRELHDYLGLSWEEYGLWVERPEALRFIIAARHRPRSGAVELMQRSNDALAAAARAADDDEARAVLAWLAKTGRLDASKRGSAPR